MSALGSLGIGIEGGLVLFEELLLHCDIMVSNAKDCQSIFWLLNLLRGVGVHLCGRLLGHYLGD